MNNLPSFLQLDQVKVKMNKSNDYVYHFLQLIQVNINNFSGYVCNLLQLVDICVHASRAGAQS